MTPLEKLDVRIGKLTSPEEPDWDKSIEQTEKLSEMLVWAAARLSTAQQEELLGVFLPEPDDANVVPADIQAILDKCVCGECGGELEIGHWRSEYEYIRLTPESLLREVEVRTGDVHRTSDLFMTCTRVESHDTKHKLYYDEMADLWEWLNRKQ